MLSPKRLFGNLLDDERITPIRLSNFAQDTLSRLTLANPSDSFTTIINQIAAPLNAFKTEINDLEVSLGVQMGKTLTVDNLVVRFKKFMSDKEGVIADKLGGFETPAYLEFYPKGVSEYSVATKAKMAVLTERLRNSATVHSAALGEALSKQLCAFAVDWNSNRNQQETVKGDVSISRVDRSSARKDLETALIVAIHTIAAKYPSDVKKCHSFFDFNLLYAKKGNQQNEEIVAKNKDV